MIDTEVWCYAHGGTTHITDYPNNMQCPYCGEDSNGGIPYIRPTVIARDFGGSIGILWLIAGLIVGLILAAHK